MTPDECRTRRTELGMSTERLASLAGLAERTVVKFEASLVSPRPGTVIALGRAFRKASDQQREGQWHKI